MKVNWFLQVFTSIFENTYPCLLYKTKQVKFKPVWGSLTATVTGLTMLPCSPGSPGSPTKPWNSRRNVIFLWKLSYERRLVNCGRRVKAPEKHKTETVWHAYHATRPSRRAVRRWITGQAVRAAPARQATCAARPENTVQTTCALLTLQTRRDVVWRKLALRLKAAVLDCDGHNQSQHQYQ